MNRISIPLIWLEQAPGCPGELHNEPPAHWRPFLSHQGTSWYRNWDSAEPGLLKGTREMPVILLSQPQTRDLPTPLAPSLPQHQSHQQAL